MRSKFLFLGILLLLFAAACADTPEPPPPTDTPTAAPTVEQAEEVAEEAAPEEVAQDEANTEAEAAASTTEGEEALEEDEPLPPTADHPLINELTIGIAGNNNHEFIELYNPTNSTIDLNGWSLWHQIRADENPQPPLPLENRTDLPPNGYLLLVRQGEDVGCFSRWLL